MTRPPDIVPDQATAEESAEFASDMAIAARNALHERGRRSIDVDESEHGEPEGDDESK